MRKKVNHPTHSTSLRTGSRFHSPFSTGGEPAFARYGVASDDNRFHNHFYWRGTAIAVSTIGSEGMEMVVTIPLQKNNERPRRGSAIAISTIGSAGMGKDRIYRIDWILRGKGSGAKLRKTEISKSENLKTQSFLLEGKRDSDFHNRQRRNGNGCHHSPPKE